jgi:restriction system protein
MTNQTYKRERPISTYVAWWIYVGSAAGIFVFFRIFVHDFHLTVRDGRTEFLDSLLHARVGLYASYATEAVLIFYGLKSLFHKLARDRFLKRRRSIEALQNMPWQDFELLVAEVYRAKGYDVVETGLGGADGGVDLRMTRGDENAIVQCKRWKSTSIGAPIVREMYGVMSHVGAHSVKIVCVGKFTREATAFAEGKPIELVSGHDFLEMLRSVQ